MRTEFFIDKEKNVYEKRWIISNWLEKLVFVVGIFSTGLFFIGMMIGLVEELTA